MEALLDLTAKSTLLLSCAAVVVLAMRRASAASRHLAWMGAFCAIALLPVARLSLPALRIPILTPAPVVLAPQPIVLASAPIIELPMPVETPLASPATRSATPVAPPRRPVSIADLALAVWIAGAIVLTMRHLAGWFALKRVLARAARVKDSRALGLLRETADGLHVRRRIALLSHDSDGPPCTCGVVRPAILLPAFVLTDDFDGTDRLRAILVHETAHIARHDALADRFAQVAVMMFWFNPLMWFAARQARIERERAADDAVLATGARPSDYATDLLAVARLQSTRFMASALPMAASGLERRVRAILDAGVRRGGRSSLSAVIAITLVAAMLPVSAARLVARAAVPVTNLPVDLHLDTAPATLDRPRPPLLHAPPLSAVDAVPEMVPPAQEPTAQAPQAPQADVNGSVVFEQRAAILEEALKRAHSAWSDALKKIEIGTVAPIDTAPLEAKIVQVEQMLLAAQKAPAAPMRAADFDVVKVRYATALKNLDAAQVRWDNGLIGTREMADAIGAFAAVAQLLSSPADAMFTSTNFPGSSQTDRNSARALYELLTGRVASVNGAAPAASAPAPPVLSDDVLLSALQNAPKIASETERADALVALAQRYALTPDMVAAYVAAANSIKNETDRSRVFAQSVRVKSPGKGPEWYWQR